MDEKKTKMNEKKERKKKKNEKKTLNLRNRVVF
jgi:hypothetical protein